MGPHAEILRDILGPAPTLLAVSSQEIVDEWTANALKKSVRDYFARRGVDTATYVRVLEDIVRRVEPFEPTGEAPPCRDPKDRKYLHLAEQAQVRFLITSDDDLLDVGEIGECRIVTAQVFVDTAREPR